MAFGLLVLLLMTQRRPRFSQFTSTVFGLFYCGYLPSFWLKLRMLSLPVGPPRPHSPPCLLHPHPRTPVPPPSHPHRRSRAEASGPVGGLVAALLPRVSLGLVATVLAVLCIVAADTGAYVVGKSIGRTQLVSVSPKKTVEGAVGGLLSSCAVGLLVREGGGGGWGGVGGIWIWRIWIWGSECAISRRGPTCSAGRRPTCPRCCCPPSSSWHAPRGGARLIPESGRIPSVAAALRLRPNVESRISGQPVWGSHGVGA